MPCVSEGQQLYLYIVVSARLESSTAQYSLHCLVRRALSPNCIDKAAISCRMDGNDTGDNYTLTYHFNGAIFGIEAVLSVTLNFLCITYFIQQKETSTRFLYLSISVTDFCIGISRFFNCIDLLGNFFGLSTALCPTIGRLDMLLIAVSIYLIMLLSIIRAMCVFNPLRRFSVTSIKMAIIGYVIFYFLLGLVPMLDGSFLEYSRLYRFCGYKIDGLSAESIIFYIFMWYIPTFITCIPILICFVITLSSILRQDIPTDVDSRVARDRIEAGKTVVLLTAIYIICNVPCWIQVHFSFTGHLQWTFESDVSLSTVEKMWWYWFTWKHLVVINSILNSVAYFYRLSRLRRYVIQIVRCKKINNIFSTTNMSSDNQLH